MIGPDEPVMCCDLGAPPVAPTALRADRLRVGAELLRPAHEAVGFAEGRNRHDVATEIDLLTVPREEEAASQQSPVAVSPCARAHDFDGRGRQTPLAIPTNW